MALMDGMVWRGEIYSGGIVPISEQTAGDGPSVRLGAAGTGARRVMIRGDITPIRSSWISSAPR